MQTELQAYRRTNIVVIIASILAITLPALILNARLSSPQLFPECYSIMILGRPCPMCGLTRGIGFLLWGQLAEANAHNVLSVPFLLLFMSEIAFRVYAAYLNPGIDKLKRIKRYDKVIHITLFVIYMIWAALFHIML